jgi:hypothetical protein
LYLICVVYLDFLVLGPQEQLPSTLPRIRVWKQDMIKEFSELGCVEGHIFGKRRILSFKSTCYSRRVAGRTPSPACDANVLNFKNELLQRVPGTFSPQSLDDITALYTKHAAAAPNELSPDFAQSIIVDVIDYFYQRAQREKSNENMQSMNNGEATCSGPSNNVAAENNNADNNGQYFDEPIDNVVADVHSPVQVREDILPDVLVSTPIVQSMEVGQGMSGDTEIVPSSGGHTQSGQACTGETEEVASSSPDVSNQLKLSQGCSQGKKRSVSDSLSDVLGNNVATQTRSCQNSLSPSVPLTEVDITDNLEAILRKKRVKRLAIRSKKSLLGLRTQNNVINCSIPTTDNMEPIVGVEESCSEANDANLLSSDAADIDDRAHFKVVANKKLKDRLSKTVNDTVFESTSILSKTNDVHGVVTDGSGLKGSSDNFREGFVTKSRNLLSEASDKSSVKADAPLPSQGSPLKSASFDYLLNKDISTHSSRDLQPSTVSIWSFWLFNVCFCFYN